LYALDKLCPDLRWIAKAHRRLFYRVAATRAGGFQLSHRIIQMMR
jgi:hypothetical protein